MNCQMIKPETVGNVTLRDKKISKEAWVEFYMQTQELQIAEQPFLKISLRMKSISFRKELTFSMDHVMG